VGERPTSLLAVAQLVVIPGDTHDLAMESTPMITPLIDLHLETPS
jgi:hypothetical protein